MTDTLLPFMYNSNNMSNGNNSSNNNNYLPRGSSCNLPSKNVQNQKLPQQDCSQISQNLINESPMIKRKKLLKSLDQSFFIRLLQVEEQISKKNLTKEIINEVVNLYAKCVEYYDSILDPIKVYFLEKIQITLSSMESLKVIYSSDENSTKKDNKQIKELTSDNMLTPSHPYNRKLQKNSKSTKPQISKFQTESSINTNQNSSSSIASPFNNFSSQEQIKKSIKSIPTPAISKRESINVSEFSSSSPTSQYTAPMKTNSPRVSNQKIKFLMNNINTKLNQSNKRNNPHITSPNSAQALNQSLQKTLSSIQSSFMKESPNQEDKIKNIDDLQNRNNIVIESFVEDDSYTSNQRLRFTLNPNTLLNGDLNFSDLNIDNSLTNTSHNSRIEMNVKNIVGENNYQNNYCDKKRLIEHGKTLFNKNLERQSSNTLLSICNQLQSSNINNTINNDSYHACQPMIDINQKQYSPKLSPPCFSSQQQKFITERTILGIQKNYNNSQKTSTQFNQLNRQNTCNLEQKPKESDKNENLGLQKPMLYDDKENFLENNGKSVINSSIQQKQKAQIYQSSATTFSNLAEYSISQKKVERAKRFSMFITMQNQKKQSVIKQDFNKILNRFEQDAYQKDQIVKSDIDNQMEIIKQRLQRRKSKNIQERIIKDIQTRQETIKELLLENGSQTSRF